MPFGLPQRKTSKPPPYIASQPYVPQPQDTAVRRARVASFGWIFAVVLLIIVFASLLPGLITSPERTEREQPIPPGTPPVVLVTTIDPKSSEGSKQMIRDNRQRYAALHGYETFMPDVTDYPLRVPKIVFGDSTQAQPAIPASWSKIPAVRHAMTKFPYSTFFFYLDRTAVITNPSLSVLDHIANPARLYNLTMPEQPVVPPDSVIRTLPRRQAQNVDFIVTQDHEGLSQSSFIIRRGDWAKYFLDAWYDPLYRSYNFQRAERHALEHLVQWHGTILARLALIPQTVMNSYVKGTAQELYQDGHFVANLKDCDMPGQQSCEQELRPLYERFLAQLPKDQG